MNAMVKPQSELEPINRGASDDSKVLMMIVQKMSEDPDFDIEKVEKMIAIKERLDANAARKAYAADMAEFKKVAPTITKDRHVFFKGKDGKADTSYDHASLGNVVETAIAKLAEFGFSHRWTAPREGDRIVVTCTLTHRMGHSESETQDGSPDVSGNKSALQSSASTRTFLERYTFLAVTGLATKAQLDDDGRGGPSGEEEAPNPEAVKIEKQWIETIAKTDTLGNLSSRRKEVIEAYKGQNNVPEVIRKALLTRKKELTPEGAQ